jgi:hypothetical protein
MKHLSKMIGTWQMKGRSFGSDHDNVTGRVTIEWFPGGFFMMQRGEMGAGDFQVKSLEVVGYDPVTKVFPSYVYSNLFEFHSKYFWDVRGDIVEHWTKGAKYTGKFSPNGTTLSGGWRPTGSAKKTPGNTYDVVMTRVE